MKKMLSCVLAAALLLALLPAGAMAAGKIKTTQENFFVTTSGSSVYGYAYARIENVGDKPAEYSAGLLEIYDSNGDTLTSENWLSVFGKYLQPGEYAYVRGYDKIDNAKEITDVDDYALTITGKSSSGKTTKRFACTTQWLPDFKITKYTSRDYMVATFTNDTDDVVYDIEVVLALLDDENNILNVDSVSLYSTVGVNPGSSVTVRQYLNTSMRDAIERAGLTPTHVDAYAYVYLDD